MCMEVAAFLLVCVIVNKTIMKLPHYFVKWDHTVPVSLVCK